MTANLTEAPLALVAVTYGYGNEHDPVATIGRFVVDLSDDSTMRLEHITRDRRRAWTGTLAASVWPEVIAHLATAGFPSPKHVAAPLRPGTPSFSVSARGASGEAWTVQLPGGVPFEGYRELSLLMMSIVSQVSDDILGFALPSEPRLVTGVARK